MAGPWEDYAPTKATKVSGPWDDYGPAEDPGFLNRAVNGAKAVTDPLRAGASNILEGLAATRRQVSGDGVVAQTLQSAGKMIAPSDYTPAAPSLSNIGDVPKAVGESAPGMAMDIPAMLAGARSLAAFGPKGMLIGGLGGLGASIWSRSYGRSTADAAFGRTGDRSVEPNSEDKLRALSSIAAETALSRVGLKAGLGVAATASGAGAARQVATQAAKAAGVNAGTEVATEGVNQALVDRKFNQERLEGAGLTGAATGGAMRGVAGVSDINAARKFGDVTAQEAAPLVKRLQALHPDDIPDTPEKSFQVMNKARQDLDIEAKARATDAREILTRLKELDPTDDTAITLEKVRKDISERRTPSAEEFSRLNDSIGKFAEGRQLIDTLQEQTVANKVIGMKGANWNESDGTFGGGAAGSDFASNYLNPAGKRGAYAGLGAAAYALTGHTIPGTHVLHGLFADPMTALALPAVQGGIYGTLKLGDKLTGNANPLKLFQQRYSDAEAAPGVDLPRFAEIMANAKMAERAETLRPQEAPVAPAAVPTAPMVAPQDLQAASEAPRGPSVDPMTEQAATPTQVPTFDITTPSGTRKQPVDGVRGKRSDVENGVSTRDGARRDIMRDGPQNLPNVTPVGSGMLSANWGRLTAEVFNISRRADAREHMENFLKYLPPEDAKAIRNYLSHHVDPSTGMTFYETWGN